MSLIFLRALVQFVDRCKRCPRERAKVKELMAGRWMNEEARQHDIEARCASCRQALRILLDSAKGKRGEEGTLNFA